MVKSIAQRGTGKEVKVVTKRARLAMQMEQLGIGDLNTRVELVQALIPIGLKAVGDLLQEEVGRLAGNRYQHGKENRRWGNQGGSVYLLDQRVPINVPRVRSKTEDREVGLETYRKLQAPQKADQTRRIKNRKTIGGKYRAAIGTHHLPGKFESFHLPTVHGHRLFARRTTAVGLNHPRTGNCGPEHQRP